MLAALGGSQAFLVAAVFSGISAAEKFDHHFHLGMQAIEHIEIGEDRGERFLAIEEKPPDGFFDLVDVFGRVTGAF